MRHNFESWPQGLTEEFMKEKHDGMVAAMAAAEQRKQQRTPKSPNTTAKLEAVTTDVITEPSEEAYDPIAKYTDAVSIRTHKGNTWNVRENSGQPLDAKLVASPFKGVELGQEVVYPAGKAIWDAEPAPETTEAVIYEMPEREFAVAGLAIAAAGR